jgi:hypothetical protein
MDPGTGRRLSVPKTKYTADRATNLPKKAIANLKEAVAELFPELRDVGICDTRMCWYTDSLDNSFVIDYVPGYSRTLFVASGGSGHGFKFLPVLGKVSTYPSSEIPRAFSLTGGNAARRQRPRRQIRSVHAALEMAPRRPG